MRHNDKIITVARVEPRLKDSLRKLVERIKIGIRE